MIPSIMLACNEEDPIVRENPADMPYEVEIDPADFRSTDIVGNDFFPISPGKVFVYEGQDEDGATIRVEEEHTMDIRIIMGVTCVIVRAREFEDGELIEDTFDWYAQDLEGNMWYFGEDSKEIEGGQVVSNAGSWEAGTNGALPGVIMLANPIPGMWYRQEYYKGEKISMLRHNHEEVIVRQNNFFENRVNNGEATKRKKPAHYWPAQSPATILQTENKQ